MKLAFHVDGLNGAAVFISLINLDDFNGLSHVAVTAKLVDLTKEMFTKCAKGNIENPWIEDWFRLCPGVAAQLIKVGSVPNDRRIEDVQAEILGVDLVEVTLWVSPRLSRYKESMSSNLDELSQARNALFKVRHTVTELERASEIILSIDPEVGQNFKQNILKELDDTMQRLLAVRDHIANI